MSSLPCVRSRIELRERPRPGAPHGSRRRGADQAGSTNSFSSRRRRFSRSRRPPSSFGIVPLRCRSRSSMSRHSCRSRTQENVAVRCLESRFRRAGLRWALATAAALLIAATPRSRRNVRGARRRRCVDDARTPRASHRRSAPKPRARPQRTANHDRDRGAPRTSARPTPRPRNSARMKPMLPAPEDD